MASREKRQAAIRRAAELVRSGAVRRASAESKATPHRPLSEGGYCFDCRIAFPTEREGDVHYAMTGHQIGWPFEDVDWPAATEAQVMGR